jgi:hypothetical protein
MISIKNTKSIALFTYLDIGTEFSREQFASETLEKLIFCINNFMDDEFLVFKLKNTNNKVYIFLSYEFLDFEGLSFDYIVDDASTYPFMLVMNFYPKLMERKLNKVKITIFIN